MIREGRQFYKMSGSGNDFIFVDARAAEPGRLAEPKVIQELCARGTGIGADGLVYLENSDVADLRMTYLNSDGSLAALCGNATLCTARLALELGAVGGNDFTIETGSGVLRARLAADGRPEIDLQAVVDVRPALDDVARNEGETRIGYAVAGVPHIAVVCEQLDSVDVVGRGRPLRHLSSLPQGANVNFVAPVPGQSRWAMRTYERGVEGETLACGTGAVATAVLLTEWGLARSPVELETRSGRILTVRLTRSGQGDWRPSLSGEARIVFVGSLGEI